MSNLLMSRYVLTAQAKLDLKEINALPSLQTEENKKYSDSVESGIAPRIRFIKVISVKKPTDKCVIGKTLSQGLSKLKN